MQQRHFNLNSIAVPAGAPREESMPMVPKRSAIPALFAAIVVCASACGAGSVTAKDLKAAPEANLYYPGSKVLGTSGSDER